MVYFLAVGSSRGLLLYLSKAIERDIDTYRPISVHISIIGKVLERIIYNQLFAYLSDHNILSEH